MEDNIVYTILILALFLLPTSVLINTSLDCTYCQVFSLPSPPLPTTTDFADNN